MQDIDRWRGDHGSDAPPGHFHQPQGFSVSLTIADPADGERKFKALTEGGTVNMPFSKTFWAKGFGMCVGPVRHSLDGQLPMEQ